MGSLGVHGILVVDKPEGPTSHDVVAWARRALGTRAVGHAGTLDPMATGVLVLGVGEGTKLTSYLMGDDKEYVATIALGAETDTLDRQGQITERADVPALDRSTVEAALGAFVGTYLQRAPVVSAIKRDGVALHERARRGEDVVAPEREVTCHGIEILDVRATELDVRVHCAKGFYVRSLGRDLARALGTRGHLSALRRTRSGAFAADRAADGELLRSARQDEAARETVRASVIALPDAVAGMTRVTVDEPTARDIGHGKRVPVERPEPTEPIAVLGPSGALLAIVRWEDGSYRVLRGFVAV